jgi:hypothetical protein
VRIIKRRRPDGRLVSYRSCTKCRRATSRRGYVPTPAPTSTALVPYGADIGRLKAWGTRRTVHGPQGYRRKPGRKTVLVTRDGVRVQLRLHDRFVRQELRRLKAVLAASHPDRRRSGQAFHVARKALVTFVALEVEWYRDVGATMPAALQSALYLLTQENTTPRLTALDHWLQTQLEHGPLRIDQLSLLHGLTGQDLPDQPRTPDDRRDLLSMRLGHLERQGRLERRRLTPAERLAIAQHAGLSGVAQVPRWVWSQIDQT